MILPDDPALVASVSAHEGLRLTPYRDTRGVWTVGYGTSLAHITPDEAAYLRDSRLAVAVREAERYPWCEALSAARQRVVVEMVYQLGGAGFGGFRRLHGALSRGDWEGAAGEMLTSRWAEQTPGRARTLAERMRAG